MSDAILVNSKESLVAAQKKLAEDFEKHKYCSYAPRYGISRTLPMNDLLHVWLTELAADLLKCHVKQINKGILNGTKRTAKKTFYLERHYPWMIYEIVCPLTGNRKKEFTSTASWKKGEMLEFMNWLQMFAAEKGTILESRGEHSKAVKQQNR